MATTAETIASSREANPFLRYAPYLFAAVTFVVLFAHPMTLLANDWWNDPDAGHGLLLAPISLWLA